MLIVSTMRYKENPCFLSPPLPRSLSLHEMYDDDSSNQLLICCFYVVLPTNGFFKFESDVFSHIKVAPVCDARVSGP